MSTTYLEITFRKGKPLAAYLYLQGDARTRSERSEPLADGLVLDFSAEEALIGIEITSPTTTTIEQVNAVLQQHELPPVTQEELSPLKAA